MWQCHWWCHWHQVMLTLVPMVLHYQKSDVHLFWSSWPKKCNGAIDDDASITWYQCQYLWCHMTKKVCCASFQLSWNKECNDAIALTLYNTDAIGNFVTWSKRACCTSFLLSWYKECSRSLGNTDGIMWCQNQWQWHDMTRRVVLPLISIVLM